MEKERLEIKKWSDSTYIIILEGEYFGKIRSISNKNQTKHAVIYEQEIPAISGPPMKKETYLTDLTNQGELEKIAFNHARQIAKTKNYFFSNKGNLSAQPQEKQTETQKEKQKISPKNSLDFFPEDTNNRFIYLQYE